ncbi:MAG: hypothetical protein HUJ56_06245 [Erysipelotrichaceae bacterium]|nr:hypothetical protein [Erysipelotrichaceae bacterium]
MGWFSKKDEDTVRCAWCKGKLIKKDAVIYEKQYYHKKCAEKAEELDFDELMELLDE